MRQLCLSFRIAQALAERAAHFFGKGLEGSREGGGKKANLRVREILLHIRFHLIEQGRQFLEFAAAHLLDKKLASRIRGVRAVAPVVELVIL